MTNRPRSHQIEDISRACLHALFERVGWAVEDIEKDYGEDLLVRIFENGVATPLKFFVQAKATDNIDRLTLADEGAAYVRVRREHLLHWNRFLEPVILTLWDSRSEQTYWIFTQDATDSASTKVAGKRATTVRLKIPFSNKLNNEGIEEIRRLTRLRYRRLTAEKIGAETLIDYLERKHKTKVEYSPARDVVIFQEPCGDAEVVLLGRTACMLSQASETLQIPGEDLLKKELQSMLLAIEEFERTGYFPIWNTETQKLEDKRLTKAELVKHIHSVLDRMDDEWH